MTKSGQPPKSFTTETRVVRKNRSAGVSPASEPRQLLLGQHDLCRLEAGDTFFLTTTEFTEMRGEYLLGATWQGFLLLGAQVSRSPRRREVAKTRRREEILCDSSRLRVSSW